MKRVIDDEEGDRQVWVIDDEEETTPWTASLGVTVERVQFAKGGEPELWMVDFKRPRDDDDEDTINYPKDRPFDLEDHAKIQCIKFDIEDMDPDSNDESE